MGRAIDLYKSILDLAAMEERAEADLKKSMHGFSSKTTDEMSALIKLIMDSLHNPEKSPGERLRCWGTFLQERWAKSALEFTVTGLLL